MQELDALGIDDVILYVDDGGRVSGIDRSRGRVFVPTDPDGQNDPRAPRAPLARLHKPRDFDIVDG